MANVGDFKLAPEQADAINQIEDWFFNRTSSKNEFYLAGYAGTGKAQPMYSTVYTPEGPKQMGQITEGAMVCTPDGDVAEVAAVYRKGKRPVYRFVFDDDTSVESCIDHLWSVEDRTRKSNLRKYKTAVRIVTTQYIVEKLNKTQGAHRFYIPTPTCEFTHRDVPVDPYVLGLLLGDGSIGDDNFGITTADEEIKSVCEAFAADWGCVLTPKASDPYTCRFAGANGKRRGSSAIPLRTALKGLGVWNVPCDQKFVPSLYLYNSREVRLGVLRGLMDSDGTVDKRTGMASFCSTSFSLAENVAELVRSLGGKASITPKFKTYTYKGERFRRQAYEVNVGYNETKELFLLPRKKSLAKGRTKYLTKKCIRLAEFVGEVDCQCIKIDHPDHLYVTDGYTTTHNTTVTRQIIERLELDDTNARACALTAKASRVLKRKIGLGTSTLHQLCYRFIPNKEFEKAQKRLSEMYARGQASEARLARFDIDEMTESGGSGRFIRREVSELMGTKLIIADECSMLTSRHIDDLARFKIPVLYIGDPGQLDPILSGEDKGTKPFSHVFRKPDVFLQQVHRQGSDSDILDVATKIRNGQNVAPQPMRNNFGKYGTNALESHPEILDWASAILCHRHVTRRTLNRKIRARRGLDSSSLPWAGETVVCRLNNHELGIARGEQYKVLSDVVDEKGGIYCWMDLEDEDGNLIEVRADRRMFDAYDDAELCEDVDKGRVNFSKKMPPFDFGYALTVHSAQGSEWDKVLVYDDYAGRSFDEEQYSRWLYAAVTRASKSLLILF